MRYQSLMLNLKTVRIMIILYLAGALFLCGLGVMLFSKEKLDPSWMHFSGYAMVLIAFCVMCWYSNPVRIDLPEEYTLITKRDNLKGYYDKSGVLHIEFDNDNSH